MASAGLHVAGLPERRASGRAGVAEQNPAPFARHNPRLSGPASAVSARAATRLDGTPERCRAGHERGARFGQSND